MALWGKTKNQDDAQSVAPPGAPGAPVNGSHAPPAPTPSRAPSDPALTSAAGAARFGIDHVIQLLRTLPTDKNPDLVITVMKATLESVRVSVGDIIKDAAHRQGDIESRVATLKTELTTLEREIELRLKEIVRLETAHAETTKVRQYLEGGVEITLEDAKD